MHTESDGVDDGSAVVDDVGNGLVTVDGSGLGNFVGVEVGEGGGTYPFSTLFMLRRSGYLSPHMP